jgi:DNA-binding PadR family transcriptional regulator
MFGACSAADDFDPGLAEVFKTVGGLVGHLQEAFRVMSTGHGPGFRGAPWGRTYGRPKGRKGWPGDFGGPWGGPWPPGPPRPQKANRGDVRAAILALLSEGPRNGYQIMSEIEERSNGAWRPSPGAVYPALQQLADEGLIEAEESGGRRTFALTGEGRRHVDENPRRARASWESMTESEPAHVPRLFAQGARLAGSIVQMAHAGTPEQVEAAEALLERTRRGMYQILAGDEGEYEPSEDEGPDGGEEPGGHGEPGGQDA